MKFYKYISMLAVALSVTACGYTNHFLDEEEVPDDRPYATLTDVNATAYDSWTYINLVTGATETHPDAGEWIYGGDGTIREAVEAEEVGIDWHIAVHRYEIKTNGASVLNTGETDILGVTELPAGTYAPDVTVTYEDELAKDEAGEPCYLLSMDMSNMMGGNIGYAHHPVISRVLSDGVTRKATGSMPPTLYGTTEEIFALKWEDGSWAKIQIAATYSTIGSSGYLSFKYKHYSAE